VRCFNPATGERLWSTLEPMPDGKKNGSGTVFLVRTPEHWLLYNDGGELMLADLSPQGYKQLARAKVIEPTSPNMGGRKVSWHHPAFADGCAFVRNDQEIICLSLR
jgi:outer membrane protein assembly factor BamB